MNEVYARIGALLKAERQRRGTDLLAIASDLKISVQNLTHVEDGNAAALPAELYFGLFAKSYATSLGIDYERTVEAIKEEIGYREPTPVPSVEEKPGRTAEARSGNLWIVAVVLAIVGSVIVFGWQFLVSSDQTAVQLDEASDESARPNQPPDSVLLGGPLTPFDSLAPLTLSLMSRVSSFGSVSADGIVLFSGEMQIGKDYPFVAQHRLVISLGTPEAVDIRLNGRKADLIDPSTRRVTGVEITPENLPRFLVAVSADSQSMQSAESARLPADSSRKSPQPGTSEKMGVPR